MSLTQAIVLERFLADPDGRAVLASFFDVQRLYHLDRAKSELLAGNTEEAKKHAHFCLAYEDAPMELRAFLEKQKQQV